VTQIKPVDFNEYSSNAHNIKIVFHLKPTLNLQAFSPTKVIVLHRDCCCCCWQISVRHK